LFFKQNGTLKIIDRVKNIFKLQQGEYVAPEKIENEYIKSNYVAQVFVYGNSFKSSIVGVIVPEELVLIDWAKENNEETDFQKLCSNPKVKNLIMEDLERQAKLVGLKGFEKVSNTQFYL
jgi:long-chain acyl-CoA synthetase